MHDVGALLKRRLAMMHEWVPDSICDILKMYLVEYDQDQGIYLFHCCTEKWMCNVAGTLHGGICATVVDHAMGCVAHCQKNAQGVAPAIQLQVSYHRPMIPGEDVLVKVRLISETRSLMSLSAEAYQTSTPDRVCLSATGTYFHKP